MPQVSKVNLEYSLVWDVFPLDWYLFDSLGYSNMWMRYNQANPSSFLGRVDKTLSALIHRLINSLWSIVDNKSESFSISEAEASVARQAQHVESNSPQSRSSINRNRFSLLNRPFSFYSVGFTSWSICCKE